MVEFGQDKYLLDIIQGIQPSTEQAKLMLELFPSLQEYRQSVFFDAMLEIIFSGRLDTTKLELIERLASIAYTTMSPDFLRAILDKVNLFQFEEEEKSERAEVLARIAPFLSKQLIQLAVIEMRKIQSGTDQTRVLAGLATRMERKLLLGELKARAKIRDEDELVQASTKMIPQVAKKKPQETLTAARLIKKREERLHLLWSILFCLPLSWKIKIIGDIAANYMAILGEQILQVNFWAIGSSISKKFSKIIFAILLILSLIAFVPIVVLFIILVAIIVTFIVFIIWLLKILMRARNWIIPGLVFLLVITAFFLFFPRGEWFNFISSYGQILLDLLNLFKLALFGERLDIGLEHVLVFLAFIWVIWIFWFGLELKKWLVKKWPAIKLWLKGDLETPGKVKNKIKQKLKKPIILIQIRSSKFLPITQRINLLNRMSRVSRKMNPEQQPEVFASLGIQVANLCMAKAVSPKTANKYFNFALKTVKRINDEEWQSQALMKIAINLKQHYPELALKATQAIPIELTRAQTVIELAPYLTQPLLVRAVNEIYKLTHKAYREDTLVELIDYLSNPRKKLIVALSLGSRSRRNESLTKVAPYISTKLWKDAIFAIQQKSKDKYQRVKRLSELFPYLPKALIQDLYISSEKIKFVDERIEMLMNLANYLPSPKQRDALNEAVVITCAIEELDVRKRMLTKLTPNLIKNFDQETLYLSWCKNVHFLAHRTRRDLLSDLNAQQDMLFILGKEQVIVETFEAIQDVKEWWP